MRSNPSQLFLHYFLFKEGIGIMTTDSGKKREGVDSTKHVKVQTNRGEGTVLI
jgi:hypothetical protein